MTILTFFIICDQESITKLLCIRLQNLITVTFYCECYILTAISIQLFTHYFIMLGCVLSTLFMQTYDDDDDLIEIQRKCW